MVLQLKHALAVFRAAVFMVALIFALGIVGVLTGVKEHAQITSGAISTAIGNGICLLANSTGVFAGVSYTNCYSGSTFDVRVNAAMSDAEGLANGNTTGILSSEFEPQAVTQTAQITVGDGTHWVQWRIGAGMLDQVTLTSGAAYAVLQNPSTAITCLGNVPAQRCSFINYSSASNIDAMYSTNGTGYYRLSGVTFNNLHGGTMASGYVGLISNGFDGSTWDNDNWTDSPASNPSDTAVVKITGVCCHSNFINDTFDSEWGATALDLEAHFNSINFHDITVDSHGATASGSPNILCHDATPGIYSTASFTGMVYMEGQSATMTAPYIQDNGCRALDFSGAQLFAEVVGTGTNTTSSIIDVSSAFETTLNVSSAVAYNAGSATWTYPVTVVTQHNSSSDCGSPPCAVAVTDSAGNSVGYHARLTQFDDILMGGYFNGTTGRTNPLSFGVGVGSQAQYGSFDNSRMYFGFDGSNALLQGASSKGVGLAVNNATFGSGYGALLDASGNFGIGTQTSAATSDSVYFTAAGASVASLYQTKTNCSSSASPAVCASAAAGSAALPTNAVSSSIVVNTTAVTANSQIFVQTDDTLGTKLGVTCNSTVATLVGGLTISARTAGTSFTVANNVAVVTNPLCISWNIVN